MAKFSERLNRFVVCCSGRTNSNNDRTKIRSVFRYLLFHTCWCSLVVGLIMLAVGVVLRSKVIPSANIELVMNSGLFFIVIGVFMIVLSPTIALYELAHLTRKSRNTVPSNDPMNVDMNANEASADDPPNDLPTYDEITQNSSSIHAQVRYPRRLDVDSLSTTSQTPLPPPPLYNEIARTESMQSKLSERQSSSSVSSSGSCSEKSIATIMPSSQRIECAPNAHNSVLKLVKLVGIHTTAASKYASLQHHVHTILKRQS